VPQRTSPRTTDRRNRTIANRPSRFLSALLSAVLGLAGLTAGVTVAAAPANAVPGTPGTPQATSVVFEEDFENGVSTTPVLLTDYVGATGQRYTADPAWLTACNGQIRSFDIPASSLGNCATIGYTSNLGQLAYALGANSGDANPAANDVVAAYTDNDPGANAVELQTVTNIPLASATGRFLTFSVDTAAVSCQASAPLYQFAFIDAGGAATNVGGTVDACDSTNTVDVPAYGNSTPRTVNVDTYTSDGSILFSGSTLGLRMMNANGSGRGNDAAFDNIRILDVTPQLDKSFSPTSIYDGQTSTLTFTITNTEELAAKNGWSFTDALPDGLAVANPSNAATTCSAGVVTAAAGGDSVAVSGNLDAGQVSCTVTVTVAPDGTGSYTNGPDNVDTTGLNPPGESTLTVTDAPTWDCTSFGYLFQTPDAATHQIYQVDLVSGASTLIGSTADNVNAVGYNTLDDYMYGWDATTATLVRIAADGTLIDLGYPDGIPAGGGFQVGDFDDAGQLFLHRGGNGTGEWAQIDLAPGSDTYGEVVDSGTATRPVGIAALPSDWTFVDGGFYGMANTTAGAGPSHLVRFDPTDGTYTDVAAVAGTQYNATYGAAYADAAGNVYVSNNSTGDIYRVNPETGASILVSNGPPSAGNDGARCADAPIPTLTVTKIVDGRIQAADQFTVGLDNADGTTLASATTTGTATTTSTVDWPVSEGSTYTVTDEMAPGSPDAISAYSATVVCTDSEGDTVTTGGVSGAWTVTIPGADAYECTVTNAPNEPGYSVSKSASSEIVNPGEDVTYTVTVTNTGTVPYTDDNQASFTDDLSAVLDDATYNGDATNGAVVEGDTLSWSGPLAVGETITVVYSVTAGPAGTGDGTLTNAVVPTTDGGDCVGECTTRTELQSYDVSKEASAETANPGDTVTYTITVTNTGVVDYTDDAPASFDDDLSAVLDDATYNGDATAGALVTGDVLTWSGPLAAGETVTISYSVTVAAAGTGDGTLTNAVVPTGDGGDCVGECATTTELQSYSVEKSSSAASVNPGDTVTYTITVTNTGQAAYGDEDPASLSDDLSEVLDDASYNGDAPSGAVVRGVTLTWSGALAVGETVTITYSVTVDEPVTGDHNLSNAVVPTGDGGECATEDGCETNTPVQSYSATKTADVDEVVLGDTVTYTVELVNTGLVDYTDDAPATFTDDLSAILDDATYNGDASNGATYAAPTISWSGPLATGETVTITYSVTVNDPATGDGLLPNTVVTGVGGNCPPGSDDPACIVELPAKSFTVDKSASSATTNPGASVTYTVTVTNTGEAAYTAEEPASFSDDLSGVLDDATYNDDASDGAVVSGDTLTWSGPLAVGETVTITYTVTVDSPVTGDGTLTNVVRPTSPGGECATEDGCATSTPVRSFEVVKTVDSASITPGATLTYTITVTNTGAADYTADEPASFTDDLSEVLDDAAFNNDATAGATYDAPVLTWSGALAVGEEATVTYSVTVNDTVTGDGSLTNAVVTPLGGNCVVDSDDPDCSVSSTVVQPPLAVTGAGVDAVLGAIAAALALLMGLAIVAVGRRTRIE
jgi:uncharacterized repeat protein (TIGR01451 family)/fimbrial isopeptide formation D2 family protein